MTVALAGKKLSELSLPIGVADCVGLSLAFGGDVASLVTVGGVRPVALTDGKYILPGDILSDAKLCSSFVAAIGTSLLGSVSVVSRDDVMGLVGQMPEGPESVPPTISPRQARLWLVQHGVTLAQVDDAIASIADTVTRETVQVEWEYGNEVHRASPWLAALGPVLGLDDTTLDQAFREAATL